MNVPLQTLAIFGNMGWQEVFLLAIVALLIFGGKRLPDALRNLGKGIVEFKKALAGTEESINQAGTSQPQTPRQLPAEDTRIAHDTAGRATTPSDQSHSKGA